MTTSRILCLVILAVASTASAQEASNAVVQQHLLRIEPSAGTTNRYLQTMQMTMSMEQGGQPMHMEQASSIWIEAKVVDVKDGKTKLEQTYKRIKVKMTGVARVDYDSDDPESRPGPMAALADCVDEKATLVMDQRGAIVSIELPAALDEAQSAGSGADLKQALAQAVPHLPEAPIEIGHEWTTQMPMPMAQLGSLECSIKNKLISVEKGLARIEQQFAFATDGLKLPGGMTMSVEGATGFTVVDLATGLPHDSGNTMTMVMSGGPTNMKMTMKMSQAMKRVDPSAEASADKAKSAAGKELPAAGGK